MLSTGLALTAALVICDQGGAAGPAPRAPAIRLRTPILIGGALADVPGLDVWLWSRNGLAVRVDAAIALCT